MKSEKGITLIALAVTVIVLIILISVGIGNLKGDRTNVDITGDQILIYELNQVQNIALETYMKYQQTGGQSSLPGTPISWDSAYKSVIEDPSDPYSPINAKISSNEYYIPSLGIPQSYDGVENTPPEKYYYSLNKNQLRKMGFDNIDLESIGLKKDDESTPIFVVNYSTGEVFNIVVKVTSNGLPLYIKAK